MIKLFYYNKSLKTEEFSEENLIKIRKFPIWIDFDSANKKDLDLLTSFFGVHQLTVEDINSGASRIKSESFSEYDFFALKKASSVRSAKLSRLDFIIGNNFLLTFHDSPASSILNLIEDKEKLEKLFIKGTDFIFQRILDVEMDTFLPLIQKISEDIALVEERVIVDSQKDLLKVLLNHKKELRKLRESLVPQSDLIRGITKDEQRYISSNCAAYFRDVHDTSIYLVNTLNAEKENINSAFEGYMTSVSNTTNEIVKFLTLIGTILLPLTFLTGVYGMNFLFLPGSKHPYGFWGMIGFMGFLTIVMLIYFKKKKWL